MLTFKEDYTRCLARYLLESTGENTEGLRDDMYQAYIRIRSGEKSQLRIGNALLEKASYSFCSYSGVPAVQLLTEYSERLTSCARERLLAFLSDNRAGWWAELEKEKCNSLRLLAAAALLGCGLLLGDRDTLSAGEAAFALFEERKSSYDFPDEYLSPFYTALQLSALAEIQALPLADSCRKRAADLEHWIWSGVLRHFQPEMPLPAGPYSRAYTSELCGHFQALSACLYQLLGQEAGFTLGDTLWNPGYLDTIVAHGSKENVQLYSLYFASFRYQCDKTDLDTWRARIYPCTWTERTHTDASHDISIKKEVDSNVPYDYPAGDTVLHTVLEEGFALAWADREFENGMACDSLQLLYRIKGAAKAFFTKLVREDRYIGEWNDYPNLGLRLGECNFPDDGRKAISEDAGSLRLVYKPRASLRGVSRMKLDLIFTAHFSLPDGVWVGGTLVNRFDGAEQYPLGPITVRDAEYEFRFEPQSINGWWKLTERNHFLNLEWVQEAEDFNSLRWELLVQNTHMEDSGGRIATMPAAKHTSAIPKH